jgi:hypothetical protein
LMPLTICNTWIIFLLQLFCGIATIEQYVCYGVSSGVSSKFSGEFPVDVSDDIQFDYNSTNFLLRTLRRGFRRVSGDLSGELNLFFLFCGWTVFCYNEAKTGLFLLPGSKKDTCQHGKQEAGKSNPRGIPSTVLNIKVYFKKFHINSFAIYGCIKWFTPSGSK